MTNKALINDSLLSIAWLSMTDKAVINDSLLSVAWLSMPIKALINDSLLSIASIPMTIRSLINDSLLSIAWLSMNIKALTNDSLQYKEKNFLLLSQNWLFRFLDSFGKIDKFFVRWFFPLCSEYVQFLCSVGIKKRDKNVLWF